MGFINHDETIIRLNNLAYFFPIRGGDGSEMTATETFMRDYKNQSQSGKDFHFLIQRIDAVSGILSQAELLDLADHLHEIVRARRDKHFSASDQRLVEFV